MHPSTPRPALFLLALAAVAFLVTAPPAAAQQQQQVFGELVSIDPSTINFSGPSVVSVRARNTGVGAFFSLEVDPPGNGWQARVLDTQRKVILHGKTETFDVEITPPNSVGFPNDITFRLFAYQFEVLKIEVDAKAFTVNTAQAPGAFDLLLPGPGVTQIVQPVTFQWQDPASGSAVYRFELFGLGPDGPAAEPLFVAEGLEQTFFVLDRDLASLAGGQTYFWNVTASNFLGQAPSANGPLAFTMRVDPRPEPFNWITPAADQFYMPLNPSFQWTQSQFATEYRLEVFPDDNGRPREPALFETFVETTNYTLFEDPLPPGFYHVLVTARNDTFQLQIDGGVRAFGATGIDAFSLLSPDENAMDLPLEPLFAWSQSLAAQAYRVEVFREDFAGPFPLVGEVVVPNPDTTFLQWTTPELEPDTAYYWRVAALRSGGDVRFSDGGLRRFTTQFLGRFAAVRPAPGSVGMGLRPEFQWTGSANASFYYVQVTPDLGGFPDINRITTSQAVAAPATIKAWGAPLDELDLATKYWWRVIATDNTGLMGQENRGSWRSFSTREMGPFDLVFPADNQQNAPTEIVLRWEEVPLAEEYVVHLAAEGLGTLPPRVVAAPASQVFLRGPDQLNGKRTYRWWVEARTATESRASEQVFQLTTASRSTAGDGDILKALLGQSAMSDDEVRAVTGDASATLDISTYLRRQ